MVASNHDRRLPSAKSSAIAPQVDRSRIPGCCEANTGAFGSSRLRRRIRQPAKGLQSV